MKAEIVGLVKYGTIPRDVASFGNLHDHIDANCLASMCVDEVFDELVARFGGRDEHEGMPSGMLDYINQAQDAVDDWLKAGGLTLALGDFKFEGEDE